MAMTASQRLQDSPRREVVAYFAVAVLGFSFWFWLVVPFASHRETYWWLAKLNSESFSYAFSFIASTYRPLHQITTWIAFHVLDASVFPTSGVRQLLLQVVVYTFFVLAWWLMFKPAHRRRVLAVVACVVGGVFFSGYVHLFHVYGLSYVPVMLMLGVLLRLWSTDTFGDHEMTLAAFAVVLVLWHPFATALFIGFYFGHYLETFAQRARAQHVRSLTILTLGTAAIGFFVFGLPRLFSDTSVLLVETATRSISARFLGFLVSYQTSEVNWIASVVALLLTLAVVVTLVNRAAAKTVAVIATIALGGAFISKGLPVVLLWISAASLKLLLVRRWSLFFLALTAAVLPFGGGIGTPIHGLFALIVAAYATALALPQADDALAALKTRYVTGLLLVPAAVILVMRAGIDLPGFVSVARPLLAERERTYQLELALAWLRQSKYCAYPVGFAEGAGNPIDSVESALTRQFRPPASMSDVGLFWNTSLRCHSEARPDPARMAIVTFGGPAPTLGLRSVYVVEGRYAGPATVWIPGDDH
jgi:hypothetical protein